MRYRHERMVNAREERKARRLEAQQDVEALLRSSLTDAERRVWRLYSDAVEQVV